MKRVSHALCIVAGTTLSMACGPRALAAFVPLGANRTIEVSLRPPMTSSAFGPFVFGNGASDGAGSPPTTVSISTSQSSVIPDVGALDPVITYSGNMSGSRIAGATTNRQVLASNLFELTFQLTTPMTLVHTLAITSGTSGSFGGFSATVNSTNLLTAPGGQVQLSAGVHRISIVASGSVGWGFDSFSQTSTLAGDVRFVPGPSVGLALLAPAVCVLSVRRRTTQRSPGS